MEQASTAFNKREFAIAKYIIYSLNENGFMEVEVESIASSLSSTPEEIERIRNVIKSFNPLGVAAKSLSECLLAQVEDEEDKLRILIENHLDDLAKSKYEQILDRMKISNKELTGLITRLRRLNPRPGARFEKVEIDYAQIDLLLIKQGDDYVVKYIDEGIPTLSLSSYYDQMLDKAGDKKTKSYLKDRVRNANLFIDGIELRKSMILQIAEYLVKVQKDYLDFGEKWKKPLTMKEVSNELGFSESSVSRTVNNKFIASEKGIIKLKSFFSHGIKGEFGFVHSVETIKDKIKKIVEEESRGKPFSDQQISQKMQELGITISRRTIRNYRTEMNILSSSKRKQEYNLTKE
jgi:RNA polymerase sigma-54 factor